MKTMKTMLLGAALLGTSACTNYFNADVTRFQRLPAPSGETFAVVPASKDDEKSLEFATYARYVAGELVQEGYQEVANPADASMLVALNYGVGDPREKLASRPSLYASSRFGYPWYGYYGYRSRWAYDPWFYGPGLYDRDIYSYTVYPAYLEMDIRRKDGEPLFEGRAVSTARTDNLPALVPNLVTAMFTDFPTGNGQTMRVRVPQDN